MDDLKLIKKYYGEEMMHLCRELFPTLLEEEGLLFNTLSKKFNYCKYIAEDIRENHEENIFKEIILAIIKNDKNKNELPKTDKTPKELLEEEGYILYECHSEEDIQSFKKYYAPNEKLCTFNGDRLDRCHVFFAVKKNVNEIKRENFSHPEREDEYGTSVISIQFSRGKTNTLSIKNRYNHTVSNPDATFSNNLENIKEGLTYAFGKKYGLNINQNSYLNNGLNNYVLAKDGKFYRYNYEDNGIFYCPDNIIIDNYKIIEYDKSRYLIMDGYILDMHDKTLTKYEESFHYTLDKIYTSINNIKITNNKKTNTKELYINDDTIIVLNKRNRIIGYKNTSLKHIESDCDIAEHNELEWIDLPNVKIIEDGVLKGNMNLKYINLPNVEKIGDAFLTWSKLENELSLPKCKEIGDYFAFNSELQKLNLPEVIKVGNSFLEYTRNLDKLSLPKCKRIGQDFLQYTLEFDEIDLPEVEVIPDNFMKLSGCNKLNIQSAKIIGNNFMRSDALNLKELELPNVEIIGDDFLLSNKCLYRIYAPKVKQIGRCFLLCNQNLEEITLESVEEIKDCFLKSNEIIKEINIPNIKTCDNDVIDVVEKANRRMQKIFKKE